MSTIMFDAIVKVATLLLLLPVHVPGVAGEWSSELKYTVPCETVVDFPCAGGCGASDCQSGGRNCWTDYFIQCKCIPEVLLKDMASTDAVVSGIDICIWSILAGGGEPVCCSSYGRRGLSASTILDNKNADVALTPKQRTGEPSASDRDGTFNVDEDELSRATKNKHYSMANSANSGNKYGTAETDGKGRRWDTPEDVVDKHPERSDNRIESDTEKRTRGGHDMQIKASLLMRAICGYLIETGANIPQCL